MSSRPYETEVPSTSAARANLAGASFFDAWTVEVEDSGEWAIDYFVEAAQKTPRWVDACMGLRNRVVRFFGLKHLGVLSSVGSKSGGDYRVGERAGIFTVFGNEPSEAQIGDKDKHLDVVLYVHKGAGSANGKVKLTVTTVVHVKNLLGRLYMIPVAHMHKVITPAVLGRLVSGA